MTKISSLQLELAFAEISNVTLKESDIDSLTEIFTVSTISKEVLKFQSVDAPIIFKWLNYLLSQLKKRSTFAVAIQNFSKTSSEENYLQLKKGDLITLDQNGEALTSLNSTWAIGSSEGKKGFFLIESAYILPCIEPPRREILELFSKDSSKQRIQSKSLYNTIQRQKMHSLKKFAADNFRPNIE